MTPPDYTHAYLPNRNREAPIAVMEIIVYRLRQSGVSFVRNQYDGKNVFSERRKRNTIETDTSNDKTRRR